ncbi:MAG: hypothetical protein DRJ69_06725 [Thermoprotei archaeon]|nr:MAG: hypothetical protein DRJ69_06725 [Thermoprotei archaeon]
MGTYIRIIKFPDINTKFKFENKLNSIAEKSNPVSYDNLNLRIVINNEDKEFSIPLKLKVKKIPAQRSLLGPNFLGHIFEVETDIPLGLENLDGFWNVKEKKTVTYISYKVDPISTYSLLTGDSKKGVEKTLDALHKLKLPIPVRMKIKFLKGSRFIKLIKDMGSIGWIYLGGLTDYHLKGFAAYGKKLEASEIISDLVRRGGMVTAIVIYSERKNLKVILSDRGSIYSPHRLKAIDIANITKDILEFFQKHSLISVW